MSAGTPLFDPLGFLQNALGQVEQYEASHGKAA